MGSWGTALYRDEFTLTQAEINDLRGVGSQPPVSQLNLATSSDDWMKSSDNGVPVESNDVAGDPIYDDISLSSAPVLASLVVGVNVFADLKILIVIGILYQMRQMEMRLESVIY